MGTGLTLTFLFLIEALLIAAGLAIYFIKKYRDVVKQNALEKSVENEGGHEINLQQALELVILETQEMLQLDDNDIPKNHEISDHHKDLLLKRLNYLRAERASLEGTGEQTNTQWSQLYERLDLLFYPPKMIDDEEVPLVDLTDGERKVLLQAQNLATDIRTELAGFMGAVDALIHALPEDGQGEIAPPGVMGQINDIEKYRGGLIEKIQDLETLVKEGGGDGEEIFDQQQEAVSEIEKLKNMLSMQKDVMAGLTDSIMDDGTTLAALPELENQLQEIELANKELRMCVDVLKLEQRRITEEVLSDDDKELMDFSEIGGTDVSPKTKPATVASTVSASVAAASMAAAATNAPEAAQKMVVPTLEPELQTADEVAAEPILEEAVVSTEKHDFEDVQEANVVEQTDQQVAMEPAATSEFEPETEPEATTPAMKKSPEVAEQEETTADQPVEKDAEADFEILGEESETYNEQLPPLNDEELDDILDSALEGIDIGGKR